MDEINIKAAKLAQIATIWNERALGLISEMGLKI